MSKRDYDSGNTDEERDLEAVAQRRRGLHIVPSAQEPVRQSYDDEEWRELMKQFKRPAKGKRNATDELPPAA